MKSYVAFERLTPGKMVDVLPDGSVVAVVPDSNAAFLLIAKSQNFSVAWALRWDGWSVRDHEED